MRKTKFWALLIFFFAHFPLSAQDLSVDEAIAKITSEAKAAVLNAFRSSDETGDSQFVDAEIVSVHDFNDYSFGSLIPDFEAVLDRRLKLSTSNAPSAMWPEDRKAVQKENPRILQYAKDNLTRIVGYSAVVDYIVITKFRERKEFSKVLYFNSKGEFVDIKDNSLSALVVQIVGEEWDMPDREDAKKRLAPYMFRQIVAELREMNDPLFLKKNYWVSTVEKSENSGKKFELQWCYRFTKENTDDSTIDKGKFKAYYYQIQKGSLQTIKMIITIDGTYEKDKEHIWFSYDTADVTSYHITNDVTRTFDPGNYKSIDFRKLNPQVIETLRVQKLIRGKSNTPDGYKWIDDKDFQINHVISLLYFDS